MIERFNFYDIYAYLIPGFVLVALLWLPFGITAAAWPQADVSWAVTALVLGYVVGHVLHTISGRGIPVTVGGRFPSEMALSGETETLSAKVVAGVKRALRDRYGLDLEPDVTGVAGGEDVKQRLADAPRLCRADLVREKVGTYAEQFQGMYALMRGLIAGSLLGGSFYLGWLGAYLVPGLRPRLATMAAVGWVSLLVAAIVSAGLAWLVFRKSRLSLWALVALIGLLGLASGSRLPLASSHAFILLVATAALVVVYATSRVAFRRFTTLWAEEIFRGFYALALEKGWTAEPDEVPDAAARPPEQQGGE